jgi:ATP-binding cassette, subfamily B, bacterial
MKQARSYSKGELLRRIAEETRPYWMQISGLLCISLLSVPITLASPLPLKWVVDGVVGTHSLPAAFSWLLPEGTAKTSLIALGAIAAVVIAIAFLKQLADLAFAVLRTYAGEKLVLGFRAKLFRHSQNLSLRYHDTAGTSDSTYRIQYDAPAIQWIGIDAAIPLVTSVLTLVAMLVVMAQIDWQLALVALAVVPVLFGVSQFYTKKLKLRWRDLKNLESSSMGVIQEVLSSVRVVKAFAQEDREQSRYMTHAGKSLRQQLKLSFTGGTFSFAIGMLMALGTATVLFLGARHVQTGVITMGELILMMSYLAMLYSPLQTLSKSAGSLQGSIVSMERALSLLDEAPEVVEAPNAQPLLKARGDIEFRNVTFSYSSERRPALGKVSFKVAAGSRVGIAGTTGAGKSTLITLLLRLYDPNEGAVLLDGVDLREYKLRDLRNQFAIVLQEPILFSRTIGENIIYARPDAGREEMIQAAKAANAHEFIMRLTKGYETEVGERGVQLSGGERQRISLARAFLKDAPILILDEPTSSVDLTTELAIIEAMKRLMAGRTSFMIAHRLSTLDICDVRINVELGQVISVQKTAVAPSQQTAIPA